ncbi:platelet glycoprotein Ib alpha chain-like [Aphidius gifuensis]|uniref:platelet glycoprotein Ib alpha chain-like n=1 Tax=Aphidius gifuensis TaxID=684658 RepID=UPI001CDC34F5|nr:platelet glycoprotein Ib alpha chain-like [Aphidius gifuensis]XP_044012495.1 platelet glycoprotein Ib alpha chain-like [Aphidius gifuensis]
MRLYVLGLLTLLLLVNEPNSASGICTISKNGIQAKCQYIEDIKNITINNELKNLKILNIDKNISTDIFNNLKNLRNLDLSNGKLHKLKTGLFLNLRELRSLDLSNNNLHNFSRGTFDGLLNLQYLNLHGNYLDKIPNDTATMKNLISIDLSKNKLICDCTTLKERDNLLLRGVNITNKTYCYGPGNLKGIKIHEPNSDVICSFEEQDDNMQADEPVTDESSGEIDDDSFDKIADTNIPDEDKNIQQTSTISTNEKIEETTKIPATLNDTTVTSANDGMGFSEDINTQKSTTSLYTGSELIEKNNDNKLANKEMSANEGSGSVGDDLYDGSGAEGSGIGTSIVQPIDWSGVTETSSDSPETSDTPDTSQSPKPTESSFWAIPSLFDLFGTSTNTTKNLEESTTVTTTTDDLNLDQDEFLPVSTTSKTQELTSTISNNETVLLNVDNNENLKTRIIDNDENPIKIINDNNELPDASSAVQTEKSHASYYVLVGLLVVLTTLIGIAAYRGDFCTNKNKNNNNKRNPEFGDIENGTELKDLTKSLIDDNNTTIKPMINNKNGNKHETVPLVNNENDKLNNKDIDEPIAKYIGNVSDSNVDPIKPPRKSYSPNEHDNDTNNYNNEEFLKQKNDKDLLVNGKHERDSLSSGNLSNQFNNQSSPGAQRVKITLQDNPDSVPKTPLLITKIIGGENLVKTSP